MKKILFIFGTRPEAIKLAPLVRRLRNNQKLQTSVCVTGQHRGMLDQVLHFFDLKPHHDLNLMKANQSLAELTANCIHSIDTILAQEKPNAVIVQGDTTTAFVGALAAFYHHIPIGHVEAGLRTYDLDAPFPEEANRTLISTLAQWHFAPTSKAAEALRRQGVHPKAIYITGNTIVEALKDGIQILEENQPMRREVEKWFDEKILNAQAVKSRKSRLILITGHRRESFGKGFESICESIKILSKNFPQETFVYPVHLNPNVQTSVYQILKGLPNVKLLEPIEYSKMLFLLSHTYLILTDSGGIQEEAPSLKIPTLVMREKTERAEGVEIGAVRLVGSEKKKIIEETANLLNNSSLYQSMQTDQNPYGNGLASEKIIEILQSKLL